MAHKVSSSLVAEESASTVSISRHQHRQLIDLVCASQYEDGFYGGMDNPYSMGLSSGHGAHLNHAAPPPPPMHNSYHGANNHVMSNNVMGAIPDVHKRDKDAIYRYGTYALTNTLKHAHADALRCLDCASAMYNKNTALFIVVVVVVVVASLHYTDTALSLAPPPPPLPLRPSLLG